MQYRSVFIVCISAACAAALWSPLAHAAAATGTALTPLTAPAPTPNGPSDSVRKPLLVIHFNQHHVYFDRALRDAITAAEKSKAGIFYEVISYVPTGNGTAEESGFINSDSAANLNAVVQEMRNLGIPDTRMRTTTESMPSATSQDIDIFVY